MRAARDGPPSLGSVHHRRRDQEAHKLRDRTGVGVGRPDAALAEFGPYFFAVVPVLVGEELVETVEVAVAARENTGDRVNFGASLERFAERLGDLADVAGGVGVHAQLVDL